MDERTNEITADDLIELEFLERLFGRLPQDILLIKALADFYTRVGRYEDGLRLDQQLGQLCPGDALVWYNLGCSLALLKKPNEAFDALQKAIAFGYDNIEWMRRDEDLRSIRNDVRFRSLLQQIPAKPD
jgi:tetratricopeptide (TPR) repeat protein